MGSRLTVDPEKLAAIERYNEANGFGPQDPKVRKLERLAKGEPVKKRGPYQKRRNMTDFEKMLEAVENHGFTPLKPAKDLPPYDVTKATRYSEAVMWTAKDGAARLDRILKRYAHVMKPQGITASDFKSWREHFMLMTVDQLAALVRVTPRTVRNWENGESEIPFSMWWVMHSTVQDPENFLTRPGFHDFYIEYVDGEAVLCSSKWPDIRYTAADLFFNRCALSEVHSLRAQMERQESRLNELTAENTKLRQMLKAKGLTTELQAMHEQLTALMQKITTADVVEFPEPAKNEADIIPLKQATA
jgi:DNA-binding transcriptional regulator YiaG